MIRPESVGIGAPGTEAASSSLVGRVGGVSFMGNHTRITVDTAAGTVVVHQSHATDGAAVQEPSVGEEACVWWPTEQATILEPDTGGGTHGSTA
jgi:ABC-type Fe3+/spermidine/putrescine transport system ATPase subunit